MSLQAFLGATTLRVFLDLIAIVRTWYRVGICTLVCLECRCCGGLDHFIRVGGDEGEEAGAEGAVFELPFCERLQVGFVEVGAAEVVWVCFGLLVVLVMVMHAAKLGGEGDVAEGVEVYELGLGILWQSVALGFGFEVGEGYGFGVGFEAHFLIGW